MHEGMQYHPIQGQIKVMSPRKSEIGPFWKAIFSPVDNGGWQMTEDSYITAQYLQLIRAGFKIFVIVFLSHDSEVGSKYE